MNNSVFRNGIFRAAFLAIHVWYDLRTRSGHGFPVNCSGVAADCSSFAQRTEDVAIYAETLSTALIGRLAGELAVPKAG